MSRLAGVTPGPLLALVASVVRGCLYQPLNSGTGILFAVREAHSSDQVKVLLLRPTSSGYVILCHVCWTRLRIQNPERSEEYVEPDILLCLSAEQRSAEEPDQNQVSAEPAWKLAESWKRPEESSRTAILSFTQPSGPNHFLSKNSDAIDFFSLLFPPALVELIAKETNAHAKACRLLGCCPPDWVPVTGREVKGFLGLVILMGVHNLPDPAHYWSFNHFDNSYTFHRAMPLRRFQQIAAHLRMGSFVGELHGPGRSTDPLQAFRPMLGLLGSAMWDAYRPNCCLAVDRALLPTLEDEERGGGERGGGERGGGGEEERGGGERGGGEEERGSGGSAQPQVWLLCDSKSGYCHRLSIQLGRRRGLDLGFSVVPELVRDLDNKHHQLFLANSLASIPLMQMLLKQNIYACSSFPPPSPILPRPLWDDGELHNPGDFLQRQCGPLLVTRWRDTKEMGCLSTNAAPGQPDAVWRSKAGGLVTIERPMAFRLLQENMRGVDICKQLLACNPLGGVPQDRHWRNLFWFLVNLSVVNAFIVLRESRKDNPPAWVQDGLFSQLAFRRRLGNQLARCAQRHGEGPESPGPRGARAAAEEPVQQRHKMAKISSISKRCRNCNMKNLRHESVYGCTVCDANLCKRPSCFWEFHGLPPLHRGSTKLGFLKDRLSGEIVVDEVSVDETFGPVEDLDFSDDEPLDEPEDEEEMNPIGAGPESSPPTESGGHDAMQPAVVRPGPLSVRQLRIILFALCEGLRQASRVFSTDPQLIRRWLREARARPAQEEEQHADGAARMVAWVLSMREQQLPLTESNLFNKASVLKKKKAFGDAFRISYDWAVGFLLRHRLGVCRAGRAVGLGRAAPPPLQAQVCAFREFTRRAVRSHRLAPGAVAAMDELCIFVDFRLVQDSSRRREALELSGSTPLLTVYLAVLADGTLLPALVLLSRPVPQVAPPDLALLEVRTDSLSAEDALDLWTTKVWLPHLSGPACSGKSLLVLDRHREHLADPFLAALSAARSLPAVIPSGCSFRLQPLDVCLKPALQRFLLARWARFAAGPEPELDDPTHKPQDNVTRMLVDWLLDAMMHLRRLPHTWRTSFQLTGLLQDQTGSEPRDQQTELIRTLTGILLGPDAAETEPAELQEDEDQDGDREETSEEKPMSKVDETEDRKETEDSAHETRGGQEDMETLEDSEEEEGQQRQEKTKEASRERRETRIEIGEEVGDEWKIRGDGARTEEDS
ncbi:PREDICTED: uncharacterized protein LOC106909280 [Poecilia mexicana]|uniref:uncharacterized protein LOC106909280 n=1 Tax=Poecilia mexicana TaxID=48701 RepID=UPI00072E4BDC|nr:PREDICTED: uncharacterized protein LOC106909280 [Poecilia mexicana]